MRCLIVWGNTVALSKMCLSWKLLKLCYNSEPEWRDWAEWWVRQAGEGCTGVSWPTRGIECFIFLITLWLAAILPLLTNRWPNKTFINASELSEFLHPFHHLHSPLSEIGSFLVLHWFNRVSGNFSILNVHLFVLVFLHQCCSKRIFF